MTKETKQCSVRIPEELRRWAKAHAYTVGLTLQDYICRLIENSKSDWEEVQQDGAEDGYCFAHHEEYFRNKKREEDEKS